MNVGVSFIWFFLFFFFSFSIAAIDVRSQVAAAFARLQLHAPRSEALRQRAVRQLLSKVTGSLPSSFLRCCILGCQR